MNKATSIDFNCVNCTITLRVDENQLGQTATCLHCGCTIQVPATSPESGFGKWFCSYQSNGQFVPENATAKNAIITMSEVPDMMSKPYAARRALEAGFAEILADALPNHKQGQILAFVPPRDAEADMVKLTDRFVHEVLMPKSYDRLTADNLPLGEVVKSMRFSVVSYRCGEFMMLVAVKLNSALRQAGFNDAAVDEITDQVFHLDMGRDPFIDKDGPFTSERSPLNHVVFVGVNELSFRDWQILDDRRALGDLYVFQLDTTFENSQIPVQVAPGAYVNAIKYDAKLAAAIQTACDAANLDDDVGKTIPLPLVNGERMTIH